MVNREPAEQFDPPTPVVLPSDDGDDERRAAGVETLDAAAEQSTESPDAALGFESACPVCGQGLSRFANYCPRCDTHLPFGGTFSPGKTAVAKAMSWILLVVFVGSMAVLFGLVVRQMVRAASG